MREITKCQGGGPGAVPGASNNSSAENSSEKQAVTEQCSVETAKQLSPQSGNGSSRQGPLEAVRKVPQVGDTVQVRVGDVEGAIAGEWLAGQVAELVKRPRHRKVESMRVKLPGVVVLFPVRLDDGDAWRWPEESTGGLSHSDDPSGSVVAASDCVPAPRPTCSACGIFLLDSDPPGGMCFPCDRAVGVAMAAMPPVDATDDDEGENQRWKRSGECCTFGDCPSVRENGKLFCKAHLEMGALPKACQVPGCDTILGEDSGETMCAPHRRQREAAGGKCARKGCTRSPMPDSVWCSGHQTCAASTTCDNLPAVGERPALVEAFGNHEGGDYEAIPEEEEQPNDRQPPSMPSKPMTAGDAAWAWRLLLDAFEFAWERMADDPQNDPVTVARCKRIHDFQLRAMDAEAERSVRS